MQFKSWKSPMNFCLGSCLTDGAWDVNVRTAVNSQVPTIIKISHCEKYESVLIVFVD